MQTDTAVPIPFLAALRPARWRHAGSNIWRNRIFYILIAPFAALTLVMGVWPIVLGIIVSFTDSYTALTPEPTYVWFQNYIDIFSDDLFLSSLWRTLLFTVLSVVLNVTTALALALILSSRSLKLAAPICGLALFLPVVTPEAATFIVWKWMFSIDFGAVNAFLEDMGLPDFAGTTKPLQAFFTLVFVEWWHHVGFYTIIFLTNLKLLDPTLDEAARMDGARTMQRVWNVWIPQLRPAIAINSIYAVIQFLKTFAVVVIMTNGGPNYATNFLSFYAYSKFNLADYGQALAMATVLFAIVIGLAVVVYRYNEKADYR
ncbi:carbohydrate ABC transporter permease [Oceaniglobus trochenteri]|uniref:carbohydrate ABC transporter permease n=1 Tax=Oceaniglobus trochenteri TaxID=2763260 RepID=UPI001CFF90C4|nr:sugar ABC transporter permease [Oceaniglobus trochenteri]